MLQDIEKLFDSSFFNAHHNVKYIQDAVDSIDDVVLSEDLSNHLNDIITTITSQLSTMAFCFSQLMCKTILLSENYFIIKERFKQCQIENFHLKSDKTFMDFVRKLGTIYSNQARKCNVERQMPKTDKNEHKFDLQTNRKNKSRKHRRIKKERKSLKSVELNNSDSIVDDDCFENHFLNNNQPNSVTKFVFFRKNMINNNAFKAAYRNFKEVEFISNLSAENVSLQKEIIILKSEVSSYRLMVKYLNNQLSGRIQQIQLLNRDKKDLNFNQVWNELESEILLNKYKIVVQGLFYNNVNESKTWFNLMNSIECSTPTLQNEVIHQNETNPTDSKSDLPDNLEKQTKEKWLETLHEKILMERKLKNFKQSWFNIGMLRFVFVDLSDNAIGISILGGKDYGLPIMISQIHPNTPASNADAFKCGDIILTVNFVDMTDLTHDEAVCLLTNLRGNCRFGVIHFKPEEYFENNSIQFDSTACTLSLVNIPSLCNNFYQSIFNSTVILPFNHQSDHSSLDSSHQWPSSDTDDNPTDSVDSFDKEFHENNLVTLTQQQMQLSTNRDIFDKRTQINWNEVDTKLENFLKTNCTDNKKAVPGMATRI